MAPVYEAITSLRLVIKTNLHIEPESLAWLYAATFNLNFSMIYTLFQLITKFNYAAKTEPKLNVLTFFKF